MKIIKIAMALLAVLVACSPRLSRYTVSFWGSFDTMTQIVGYAPSPEEFTLRTDAAIDRFSELGQIYDRFHETRGQTNLASLNRAAGRGARRVPAELVELLEYALWAKTLTNGVVDLQLGPVTELWRREIAAAQHAEGQPPDREALRRAAQAGASGALLLDAKKQTAELTDAAMLLDVGAIAKGYATELLARELEQAGLLCFAVSSGGNIRA
ncbi:MAG: FAD:protein FMN transferase, partial [Oscillospiraceae bacterium]